MKGTLVLAILAVKGSYSQEIEMPLDGPDDIPDTLQWWVATEGAWRVRTFALDHDIHVHSVGPGNAELIALAQSNNAKHYGEIISEQHLINFDDCSDESEVQNLFKKIGLAPRLEVAEGRFAFWKPDEARYRTQSQPK